MWWLLALGKTHFLLVTCTICHSPTRCQPFSPGHAHPPRQRLWASSTQALVPQVTFCPGFSISCLHARRQSWPPAFLVRQSLPLSLKHPRSGKGRASCANQRFLIIFGLCTRIPYCPPIALKQFYWALLLHYNLLSLAARIFFSFHIIHCGGTLGFTGDQTQSPEYVGSWPQPFCRQKFEETKSKFNTDHGVQRVCDHSPNPFTVRKQVQSVIILWHQGTNLAPPRCHRLLYPE